MRKSYTVRKQMMWMTGYFDRYGKMCTLVKEKTRMFMVDQSPLEILSKSIECIGYDLRGAMDTSKRLLGDIHHCPVLVNPIDRIVLFPTKSPYHEECTWFNPVHIKRANNLDRKTFIMFSNGETMTFPATVSSFHSKTKRAEQLEDMTKDSLFFVIYGHPHRTKKRKNKDRHSP